MTLDGEGGQDTNAFPVKREGNGLARIHALGLAVAIALSSSLAYVAIAEEKESAAPANALSTGEILEVVQSSGGSFLENRGQTTEGVRYYSLTNPAAAFRDDGIMFLLRKGRPDEAGQDAPRASLAERNVAALDQEGVEEATAYLLRFEGANEVRPAARGRLWSTSNFITGSDPGRWLVGVPSFREIVYEDLYDGIDLVFRQSRDGVKYEFVIRPGADPTAITATFHGIEAMRVDADGLTVTTAIGKVRDSPPYSFHSDGREAACGFTAKGPASFSFRCSAWDATSTLHIDPLIYSTFLGGNDWDRGYSIKVDANGFAYVVGQTRSADFPTVPGSFDLTRGGLDDAFLTKLNASGTGLIYSTYLGGSGSDVGTSVALDGAGNAYVTGQTYSSNYPVTPSAYDSSFNGNSDEFVTKLDASGSSLVFSTYFGGSENDTWPSVAVDPYGNVYLAGITQSSDFPTAVGSFDRSFNGGDSDAFTAKLASGGSLLVYSTFLGGSDSDFAYSVSVDTGGSALATGGTWSPDFQTTPGAYDGLHAGQADVFVTKVGVSGSTLDFSTFIGGGGYDTGLCIAIDTAGVSHVTGATNSMDFPTTPGAYDSSLNSPAFDDSFLLTLSAAGSTLDYSTYFGGSGEEYGNAIAVDPSGNSYITGGTDSTNLPVTPGAFDTTYNGAADAFVTMFDASGIPANSTYLGGTGTDWYLPFLAIDDLPAVYVTGITNSSDFPITPGAFDTTVDPNRDGFVTKLSYRGDQPPRPPWPLTIDGLSSDSNDSRVFHLTKLSGFTLGWTHDDPEHLPQTMADIWIATGPNRAGAIWNMVVLGQSNSTLYNGLPVLEGTCYWYSARTKDATMWGAIADWKMCTNSLPTGLNNKAPMNGDTMMPGDRIVWWNSAADADSGDSINYSWQVATDIAFSNVVSNGTTQSNFSTIFTTMPTSSYFWHVRAGDGWELTPYTSAWLFSTFAMPEAPIVDNLTLDGHLSGDPFIAHLTNRTDPVLGWSFTDLDADAQWERSVEVRFLANDSLVWNLTARSTLTWVVYAGPLLADGTDYYFRVNASDSSSWHLWSGWSTPLVFHINTPPPTPMEPIWPPPGANLSSTSMSVYWTAGGPDAEGDTVTFEYCVGTTDPPTGCPIAFGTTSSNFSSAFTPVAPNTYYWHVSAHDGYEYSANSSTWNFTAQASVINTPPIISLPAPPSLIMHGTTFGVGCVMSDEETLTSSLVVYLNYSFGGNDYPIAGPLVGNCSWPWAVPSIERTDVSINATVIDEGGLRGWYETPQFEISADRPPTITLSVPPRLEQGGVYSITWSMADRETQTSQLVVYINYSYSGNSYQVAGPLVGLTLHQWTIPLIERTDVTLNATVIDGGRLNGWDETPPFEIFALKPPVVSMMTPPRLRQGESYDVTWTMSDTETPAIQLIVYLNYSYDGNAHFLAGPLVGVSTYLWTLPLIQRTDVSINATAIDGDGMRGWSQTGEFEVYQEVVNQQPVITITSSPSSLQAGTVFLITWTMDDDITPSSSLVVYLNLTYGGNPHLIVGHLVGATSFSWTVPDLQMNDIRINATVIDEEGLKGTSETPPFQIYRVIADGFVTDWTWLWILIAVIVAIILILLILWRRRRRKEKASPAKGEQEAEPEEQVEPEEDA